MMQVISVAARLVFHVNVSSFLSMHPSASIFKAKIAVLAGIPADNVLILGLSKTSGMGQSAVPSCSPA